MPHTSCCISHDAHCMSTTTDRIWHTDAAYHRLVAMVLVVVVVVEVVVVVVVVVVAVVVVVKGIY